jgi:hypothetical protein
LKYFPSICALCYDLGDLSSEKKLVKTVILTNISASFYIYVAPQKGHGDKVKSIISPAFT